MSENQDTQVVEQQPPEKPAKDKRWGKVAGFATGSLILGIIIGNSGGGDTTTTAAAAKPAPRVTVTETVKAKPADPAPVKTVTVKKYVDRTVTPKPPAQAPAKPAAPKPAAPKPAAGSYTAAQQQAIRSAESYLQMQGFSRSGLIGQLSSKYGDGYTKVDAEFAVDHITVDWNAQAVRAAKSYLQMQGFSRAGLIQQLSSEYGDGFTLAQATYAADHVGL